MKKKITNKKNKKWKVEFSEQASKKIDEMPDKAYKELEKIIKRFKTGKIDPTKLGKPIDWKSLKVKLICPECKSKNAEWFLDKNSNKVDFHCLNCDESFWMTHKEYKDAVKRNPDKII